MRPQRPPIKASENSTLPHLLDVIEHRRTRVAWIATAHGFLIAAGLAIVWWATQSSGTPRAAASGWPTGTPQWPKPEPAPLAPTPGAAAVPPNVASLARPEPPVRPSRNKPSLVTSAASVQAHADPEAESLRDRIAPDAPQISQAITAIASTPANKLQDETDAAGASAIGLDVIARVVELPAVGGRAEPIDDLSEKRRDAVAGLSPRRASPASSGLPSGGVRPISEMTRDFVEWVMPGSASGSVAGDTTQTDEAVVLTTGQVRFDVPEPDAQVAAAIEAEVFSGYVPDRPVETEPSASADVSETPGAIEAAAQEPLVAEPSAAVAPDLAAEIEPTPEPVAPSATLPRDFDSGSFYGLSAGARTVYLLDASGSLIDTLPFAIEELYRSVRTLGPQQEYAVVFFNGDGILDAAPGGMQPASQANLTQTLTWLEPRLNHVRAKGRPDAADALAHALALRPDTIILLSDGVTGLRDPAGDRRKLVTLLERIGPGVRIHTVQFIDPDPLAARGRLGTLELLASLSNGRHRFVGLAEVTPAPRPKPAS